MNIFILVNEFLRHIFPDDFAWNLFECYCGFGVIIASIMQRSWLKVFSTKKLRNYYFIGKIGQIGLFIQMMQGLFAIIDSYYSEMNNTSHCLFGIWCFGLLLTKYSAYLHSYDKDGHIDI